MHRYRASSILLCPSLDSGQCGTSLESRPTFPQPRVIKSPHPLPVSYPVKSHELLEYLSFINHSIGSALALQGILSPDSSSFTVVLTPSAQSSGSSLPSSASSQEAFAGANRTYTLTSQSSFLTRNATLFQIYELDETMQWEVEIINSAGGLMGVLQDGGMLFSPANSTYVFFSRACYLSPLTVSLPDPWRPDPLHRPVLSL